MNGLRETDAVINLYPRFAEILTILFNQTEYFTRLEVEQLLISAISDWVRLRPSIPCYIITYPKKIGSEFYYYHRLNHLFPDHILLNPNQMSSLKVDQEIELVYIDDWVLTGIRTSDVVNFWKSIIPESARVQWTVVIGLMSKSFRRKTPMTAWVGREITASLLELIEHLSLELIYDFYLTFNEGNMTAFPVHLEYKIPRTKGSFEAIYLQCRNRPNKDFMDEIIPLYQEYLIRE